jgi:hypothetical protein
MNRRYACHELPGTTAGPRRPQTHAGDLHPQDAIVRVTRSRICGSDLHLYNGFVPDTRVGMTFGHEFTGMVEQLGEDVENLKIGDHVLVPFNIACGTCRILSRDSMAIATNPPPGSRQCATSSAIRMARPGCPDANARMSQSGWAVYHDVSSLGFEAEARGSSTVFSRILTVEVCRHLYAPPCPSSGCRPYWGCSLKKRTISADASGPLGSV